MTITKRAKKISSILKFRREPNSFNWIMEEPELLEYAIKMADLWLQRELDQKGHITADHLDKACGILSEEIFEAILDELNVPHFRTLPLLNKKHPTNNGKAFDFKILDSTIDIKAISPLPPKFGHHKNLNANQAEQLHDGRYTPCDYYICTKCFPELSPTTRPPKDDREASKKFASDILKQVKYVEFLGYATGKELCVDKNLVYTSSPFYSKRPPHRPMIEFARLFNISIEQAEDLS